MGNLISIHKDILRNIFRHHLNGTDRLLLLSSLNIQIPLRRTHAEIAAENGHLEVLKWLYERKCVSYINGIAARHGHVHILEWQWNLGSYSSWVEGQEAAYYGHINVLKWLMAKCIQFTNSFYVNAAWGGQVKVLEWLKKYKCLADKRCVNLAKTTKHADALEWIVKNEKYFE